MTDGKCGGRVLRNIFVLAVIHLASALLNVSVMSYEGRTGLAGEIACAALVLCWIVFAVKSGRRRKSHVIWGCVTFWIVQGAAILGTSVATGYGLLDYLPSTVNDALLILVIVIAGPVYPLATPLSESLGFGPATAVIHAGMAIVVTVAYLFGVSRTGIHRTVE